MTRKSPFEQMHLQLGAEMKEYHGWRLPSRFGPVDVERQALRQRCAAFDLCSFGRVSIKGNDAGRLLEAMNLTDLPASASRQWKWVKNSSQRCRIAALQNEYILFSMPGDEFPKKACAAAEKHALNVHITDLADKTAFLGLYGPLAFDSMSKLLPFEIDELTPGSAIWGSVLMMNVLLLRGSWLGTDGLELICPLSAAGLLGAAVAKYRQKYNITPAGMDCLLKTIEKNPHPLVIG